MIGRFSALCERLCLEINPVEVFHSLRERYSEAGRAYHNVIHIQDCLDEFDGSRYLAQSPDDVEYALWFHDVIYDTRAKDNEERSGELAARTAIDGGMPKLRALSIKELIIVTKHDKIPITANAKIIADVDLAILGKPTEIFDDYDGKIRLEYNWVPEEQYRAGRTRVLKSFLDRTWVYSTEQFKQKYEDKARSNLKRALRRLA